MDLAEMSLSFSRRRSNASIFLCSWGVGRLVRMVAQLSHAARITKSENNAQVFVHYVWKF